MEFVPEDPPLRGRVPGLVGAVGVSVGSAARLRGRLRVDAGGLDGHRVDREQLGAVVDEGGERGVSRVDEGAKTAAAAVVGLAPATVGEEVGVGAELGVEQVFGVALDGLGGRREADDLEVGELGGYGVGVSVVAVAETISGAGADDVADAGVHCG